MAPTLRILVTLLSIPLLWLIGDAGEELINYLHSYIGQLGIRDPVLPPLTEFVYENFPLNAGCFFATVTPFGVLLIGALLLSIVRHWTDQTFLYAFISIWFCIGIYFSVLAIAVLKPFHILFQLRSPLPARIFVLDAFLLLSVLLLCGYSLWKRGRS